MSTYQSVQSASIADASLVITKPVSLAVGDLMVAGLLINNDASGTTSMATPAGWTKYDEQFFVSNESSVALFYKIADSADVAASNFTFASTNPSSGSYHIIGHLIRVTGYGIVAGGAKGTGGSASYNFTGFTPTRANTLFVAFSGASSNASIPTLTSVALTTDNPTWTERAETSFNDSVYDSGLAVYTATRTQSTATGNVSITGGGGVGEGGAIVISLSARVDGSITPTTYVNAYAFSPYNTTTYADAIVDAPTTDTSFPTTWTNDTKPSTVWTNPDKL
jgi:hypothetical protein